MSADGASVVLGTGQGGGSVTIYPIEGDSHTEPMTRPVTAVSIASGDTRTNVAGDERGNLLVLALSDSGTGSTRLAPVTRRRTTVSAPERITAVAVGQGSDGERLVVAATRKAAFAYRVEIAAEPCATVIGGFDLLRDEGEVLDLTVDEGGRVTVLESDLNVFTFDPCVPAGRRCSRCRAAFRGARLGTDDG